MFVLDCIWVRKNEANNFYEHKQFINFNPMVGNLFVEHYFFLSSNMLTRRNKELSSAFGVASIGFSAASVQSQCCFREEFSAVHPK